MILVIGLGNPGKKYTYTRHNIGFQIVDKFKEINNFPDFKLSKKFNSLISEDIFDNEKVVVAKPQTFMNESGKAVKALINFYKTKNLFAVHDDIDLPLGKIKIVLEKGAAGHKGVESIIKEIGTKDFIRFRIGIKSKNKEQGTKNNLNVEKFVLQKFNKEEQKIIKEVIKKTVEAIKLTLKEGIKKAMNMCNK